MEAIALLLMRISTGLLLIMWGYIKVFFPAGSIGVSDKYYFGLISADMLQMPLGVLEIALGLAVVVGVLRFVAFPAQVIVHGLTLLFLLPYIGDPFGIWYRSGGQPTDILYFPSTAVFAASLAQWAFRDHDVYAVDRLIWR
jgi:putative oxidoreductase